MSETTPDPTAEIISALVASAILRRFDSIVGGPLLASPLVYAAACNVLLVVFSTDGDVLAALDELEHLEASWQRSA